MSGMKGQKSMGPTLHVVCTACNATNRIPQASEGKELNCGSCHQPLFGSEPQSLDAAGFQAQISKSQIPVVVDFWAPWCGPCRAMAPAFQQVSALMGTRARFIKVNTEEQGALASRYAIQSIPTLAIFSGGREIARRSGALPASELQRWVQSLL